MTVAVLDIGMGNTASVLWALERLGAVANLARSAEDIDRADHLILPGVGAAGHAARTLDARGLREPILAFSGPILGICLGMQLLYESSAEGDAEGLGLIAGRVVKVPSRRDLPTPHMGWNSLDVTRDEALLSGVANGDHVYFVHGFAAPVGPDTVAAVSYGDRWTAAVRRGRVMGCQFHPERSGAVGARILQNFLRSPC